MDNIAEASSAAERSSERALLCDSVENIFTDLVDKHAINAAEAGTWPQQLWDTVEEMGLTRCALPEDAGGAALPLVDALLLARLVGRFAAPIPLIETIIAAWLLSASGHAVPQGPLSIGAVRGTSLRIGRGANGWTLDGELRCVPWGDRVQHVVLAECIDGVTHVIELDPSLGAATHSRNLAGEPRTRFVFRNITLPSEAVRAVQALPPQIGLLLGAAARTQQIAGALAKARDLTLRHTADRIAFGKPLNKLQAVQQQLAMLAGHAAAASVAADMAMDALDTVDSGELRLSIAMAKARAGEAAGGGAAIAHQLHGAMGFTYEHGLHHATRRLWSWRDEFGNESYWSQRVGDDVVGRGAEHLWQTVTQAARL